MVLLAGLVVAGVAVAAESLDRPFGFFSREPSEVLGAPFYTGFLFHVGLLVWFASAVACLFGGCLVAALRGRRAAAPLLAAGLLSTVLALDDALRIHEDLLPGKLGLPKIGTYALYAVAFGAWLWFFRDFVRRTPWPLLGFAGLMLGTSVGLDRVFESHQRHLFEDGAKFVGIVAWTAYFVRTSFASALEAVAARPVSDESKAALAEPAAAPARGERRFERRRDRQPLPR
jgi:hypothetical protein